MKNEPHRFNSYPKFWMIIAVLFFILLIGITAVSMPFFSRLSDPVTQQKLQLLVESMGFSGFFLILGIQILQVIIAFIPGEPVEILAGVLYGAWGGLFLCLLGVVLASSAIFFTVRRFGYPLVLRLFGKEKIRDFKFLNNTERVEIVTFILFLIPGTPKDMLTYLAGVSGIKPSRFLLLSSFARIPSIVTSTIMGATMSRGNWEMTIFIFLLTAGTGLLGILYKDKIISRLHRQRKKPKKSDA